MNGFIRLSKEHGANCGLDKTPLYPTVDD